LLSGRQRQLGGKGAIEGDGKEPVEPGGWNRAVPRGGEQYLFAIRRPAEGPVVPGVIREAPRWPARGWHDIDISVAVVIARESEQLPVGREHRIGLAPDLGRQTPRITAFATNDPEVAGIDEDNTGAAES